MPHFKKLHIGIAPSSDIMSASNININITKRIQGIHAFYKNEDVHFWAANMFSVLVITIS